MTNFRLTTPVALLVFNRPAITERVFEALRAARPDQLLVVADGPRADRPEEAALCEEVRRIVERVDWPCEVRRNYSDINLGCKRRVSSGLDWVFEQVEEAIILEDDCLPDPSFFSFCQELLAFHRDEARIMMICGTNLLGRWNADKQSYHYSNYDWVWGWATWRRAWRHYDVSMSLWPERESKEKIRDLLRPEEFYSLRAKDFQQAYHNQIDTWDYQWTFARLMQSGLAIIPSRNLVANIGFGVHATHTKVMDKELSAMTTHQISSPLSHNMSFEVDFGYDLAVVNMILWRNSICNRIIRFCRLLKLLAVQQLRYWLLTCANITNPFP